MPMKMRMEQHEVRGGWADLRTVEQQTHVVYIRILAVLLRFITNYTILSLTHDASKHSAGLFV